MARRSAILGSAAFFLVGPLLEAGVGPWLLTGGFEVGDAWPDATALRAAGALAIAAGLAVLLWSFSRLAADGRGTPTPAAPTTRLVRTGPYAYVRHPIYLATAAIIAGEGLLLAQPILLVAVAVYLVALVVVTRRLEEPMLRARFGQPYLDYAREVPGWVPRAGRRRSA